MKLFVVVLFLFICLMIKSDVITLTDKNFDEVVMIKNQFVFVQFDEKNW